MYIYIMQNIAHFCIIATYHYVITWPTIVLTSVTCLAMLYFYTLPHKDTFSKKVLNIKCVFWVSAKSLSEAFIVRRTERDIIKNKHMSSCKIPVIIVRHSLKLNFLYRFWQILKN